MFPIASNLQLEDRRQLLADLDQFERQSNSHVFFACIATHSGYRTHGVLCYAIGPVWQELAGLGSQIRPTLSTHGSCDLRGCQQFFLDFTRLDALIGLPAVHEDIVLAEPGIIDVLRRPAIERLMLTTQIHEISRELVDEATILSQITASHSLWRANGAYLPQRCQQAINQLRDLLSILRAIGNELPGSWRGLVEATLPIIPSTAERAACRRFAQDLQRLIGTPDENTLRALRGSLRSETLAAQRDIGVRLAECAAADRGLSCDVWKVTGPIGHEGQELPQWTHPRIRAVEQSAIQTEDSYVGEELLF